MSGKGEWVNLRFPNAFAHPFSFQGRDGGTRERMLVTIPKGVVLGDGRDVGGWNLSVRATPWALAQKRAGRPVSIGLRVGRSVELFKGRGPRRVTLRLDGPEGLRSALEEHRNVMSARVAVPANPGRGCRGSLDDAAPPMDGPAGDEGMLLFNDLAFDSGFVARMDTLASRFADDFAHGRYDAGTALRETRSLVAEAAMLMETVTGASYGAGAADCAASLALSAVTDAVNGYVDDLVDRNDCDPRVAAANHAERSADPHARPGTLPCLRMFTTAYGKTDETDVFGDGAPVEGMEIPRAFVSMDPWSGTLLVGMPRGVTLPDGRDVGGYSLRKYADEREKTDWRGEEAIRVTLDDGFPARLQRGRGDDVEAVFVDASVLADAVKTRLDSALRAAEDMDWTPDFGFDVEDSVRIDRCPECFDPDRIDRSAGLHAYYETEDGGWLRLTSRSWFDPNLGDFDQVCVDYVSAAGVMVSVKDTSCLGSEEPPARIRMKVSDLVERAGGSVRGGFDPTNMAGASDEGSFTL